MHTIVKILLAILLTLFLGTQVSGQIPKDILLSMKDENFEKLDILVTDKTINNCHDIGGSSYNFLALSIKMKSIQSLRYFIQRKANLEGVCTGKTPLMYAAKYGELDAVKLLLANGAKREATNRGRTALDYAEKYKQTEIVAYLKDANKK